MLSGLQTSQDARFYALSNKFTPFSNKDKPLVVQFSIKHEQNIDCGGGYLKVFDCSLDQKDMHGESPYLLMFGPDICGPGTKKVKNLIINLADSYSFPKRHLYLNNFCSDKNKTIYFYFCVGSRHLQLQRKEPSDQQRDSLQG